MLHKICERLNSMNNFSKKVIKGGCTFSFVLCILGIGVIIYNQLFLNKVATYIVGTTLIYTSIVTFAQFVIGGLLMDFFGTVLSNHE